VVQGFLAIFDLVMNEAITIGNFMLVFTQQQNVVEQKQLYIASVEYIQKDQAISATLIDMGERYRLKCSLLQPAPDCVPSQRKILATSDTVISSLSSDIIKSHFLSPKSVQVTLACLNRVYQRSAIFARKI
jgi:hypothetical protein